MKKYNNLLTIDLGNTTISYGWFLKSKIKAAGFIKNSNIPALVKLIGKRGVSSGFNVIISSVVPKKTAILKKLLKANFKEIGIWSVGENVRLQVKMKYRRRALGADRLVNIYGAHLRFKGPVLIIDYGTAITFDYVSGNGVFEGGVIVPGIETSWEALQERAALLPSLAQIKPAHQLAGTDTKSAMYSGLLNGFGALSDGLIERFKKTYGRKLTIIATGGSSTLISKYMTGIDKVDPLHTLKSLNLIFQNVIARQRLR